MNANGYGILLSSISRTLLTRITSFPENSLCHGLKCVTEGRHKFYINIYTHRYLRPIRMGNEKKCRLRRTNLFYLHTRRLLSLRTPKSAVICLRQGEVKVCLSKSQCRSKSLSYYYDYMEVLESSTTEVHLHDFCKTFTAVAI